MLDHPVQLLPDQMPARLGPTVTAAEASGLTVKLLLSLIAWYRNIGEHATARELIEVAATRSDSQQLAQEQALLALATGELEQAVLILTELAERKDTLSAWIGLGRCQLELGNLDAAAGIAAAQVELNPDSVTALQLAGDIARAGGDFDSAGAHYEAILSIAPANTGAQAALGRLAILTGRRAEARDMLDRLLAADAPLGINQLLTLATLADLLDQSTRATSLRHQALLLEANRASRLAIEVDTALGRQANPTLDDLTLPFPRLAPTPTRPFVESTPSSATTEGPEGPPAGADTPVVSAPAELVDAPVDPRVTELLRRDFGYEHLRSGQAAVISNVLAGRDSLAIMPTGAGKSLTFQIPAMLLDGLTLVLSPLIALMKDQYDSLPPAVQARTALLNSSQSADEQRRVMTGIASGDYQMIYAAPERLRQYAFLSALRAAGMSLVVVDEAHCISLWGHDFRPDYLTIPSALRELGNPPLLAITATATRRMADGIKEGFHRALDEIRTSVFRPNLFYEAHVLANREQKVQRAIDIARQERGPGIIYVRSRKDAEAIAALLRDRGVAAVPYHAGLDPGTRTQHQDRFMSGQARVVVATTAFGMGINKADVRFIIHLSPTPSLEAYAQESGRAGRDGQPARCVLLATKSDKSTLSRMARRDEQGIDTLRRIYAGLKHASSGQWALVDPDSLLRWQPLDPEAEEEADPRIALGLLEQARLIKRHADMPTSYTMRFISPPEDAPPPDPLWDALLAWLGVGAPAGPVTFRTGEALRELNCSPDDLIRVLTSRPDVSLWDGPRQACFELLPAGADAGARIELVLARVRQEADGRIQQVMSYVHARRCRHVLLANHLGEGLASCGECCDICVSGSLDASEASSSAPAPEERSYATSEDALAVLEAVQSLSFPLGKPGWTKVLMGSVESRVRADRSRYFGRLTGMRKGTLERLIDSLVQDGWLEFFMDREYKLLRITERGRRAQLEDLGAFESTRAPSHARSAGKPAGLTSNGPEDEVLFNRLREWRRDRAIQDAVPPYVVAHDAQLRSLAEYRPRDQATLLDMPGFGPARVEKYGDEIVALIASVGDRAEPEVP